MHLASVGFRQGTWCHWQDLCPARPCCRSTTAENYANSIEISFNTHIPFDILYFYD